MGERRRWGKAGVRLSAAEARQNDARAARARAQRAASERTAYRDWAAGRMVPARITLALDAKGLDGPEVDTACKAQEPDVDRWEAGELYPTWEQVLALAELTGVTPRFFMMPVREMPAYETSLRFHMPAVALADREPPVQRFHAAAIARTTNRETTLGGNVADQDAVYAEVEAKEGQGEITDACARVIASWWHNGQASLGYAFTSTGAIPDDPSDLWRELCAADYQRMAPQDKRAADALGTYLRAAGPRGPVDGWSTLWVR